ncbi:hypothetical protein [Polluticoccus soli]|uniref:hypothetical protein n=1 Tax=Polluticoccus soli TaxID=3034150 RepID=UPI0023E297F3|nr:hypothetical protein [Flavipsychrobacter sp. JY13-12]
MKTATLLLCFIALTLQTQAQRYVFFLHNMFLEDAGLKGVHPEYGKVEYKAILDSFRNRGFVVISAVRPKGTDGAAYAQKTAKKVDSLIKKGVKPGNITVIGTSKGGYIAQYTSNILKNDKVNYVFIGSCGEYLEEEPDVKWYGNVLSIYEKTDMWLSCEKMKNRQGNQVTRYKEIELNTGLKHGYLYKAMPQWIEPAAKWAQQEYK